MEYYAHYLSTYIKQVIDASNQIVEREQISYCWQRFLKDIANKEPKTRFSCKIIWTDTIPTAEVPLLP